MCNCSAVLASAAAAAEGEGALREGSAAGEARLALVRDGLAGDSAIVGKRSDWLGPKLLSGCLSLAPAGPRQQGIRDPGKGANPMKYHRLVSQSQPRGALQIGYH